MVRPIVFGPVLAIVLACASTAAFAQAEVTPRGSPQSWLLPSEFPSAPGTVLVTLSVTATGMASACEATRPSGNARFDRDICSMLKRRARFRPATDPSGAPMPSHWEYRYTWPKAG
jgi:protein TonB